VKRSWYPRFKTCGGVTINSFFHNLIYISLITAQ